MKKWQSKSRKILSAITAALVLYASCSGCFVKDVSVKADTLAKKSSNIHQHSYMYNEELCLCIRPIQKQFRGQRQQPFLK